MKFALPQKNLILIIAGVIILVVLIIFLTSVFRKETDTDREIIDIDRETTDTGRAAANIENYLLNEFDTVRLEESERGPSYDFYLYHLIEGNIRLVELDREFISDFFQDIDLEKYEEKAKEAENLFLAKCGEAPQQCHPLWDIMPYCMMQWSNRVAQDTNISEFKKRIEGAPAFIVSLEHWRGFLDTKEWREEDLSAVLGVAVSEYLCGDMQNIDVAKWSQKTIEVETGRIGPGEKMRHSSEKIQIIIHLHDRENRMTQIPPYEGLEMLCVMPSEEEILTKGDVCDAHYYYRNKRFCLEEGWAEYDQIGKYLQERYSDPEKLICQIGLLNAFRGRFLSNFTAINTEGLD